MQKKIYASLAEFVTKEREKLGLTRDEFASRCALEVETIQSIEEGLDLFLASTIRQKLAKGLKKDNKEIKQYEIKTDFNLAKKSVMDEIREKILLNAKNPNFEIRCPICNAKLVTRIAKLYDLEDNLILHPKARCTKCPFQLKEG